MSDIHLHFHFPPPDPRIDQILTAVHQIQTTEQGIGAQMATSEEVLANLQSAASRNADAQQSVILLLQALHAEAVAAINSGNLAAFQAVADAIGNNADTLAAAVVSNPDPNAAQPAPGQPAPPEQPPPVQPTPAEGGGTTPTDVGTPTSDGGITGGTIPGSPTDTGTGGGTGEVTPPAAV